MKSPRRSLRASASAPAQRSAWAITGIAGPAGGTETSRLASSTLPSATRTAPTCSSAPSAGLGSAFANGRPTRPSTSFANGSCRQAYGGDMREIGRWLIGIAGALIAAGACYDLFARNLPSNLDDLCRGSQSARQLARELLRALGGALLAIGLTIILIAAVHRPSRFELGLVVILSVIAEGVNSWCMRHFASPYWIPLTFAVVACVGAALAWQP